MTSKTMNMQLPSVLETIFETGQEPNAIFEALMPALGETLTCDRCFLLLRDPQNKIQKVTHCWRDSPRWPDLTGLIWSEEAELAQKDPLMAIAYRTPEAVFVEDIETAGPRIVNLTYEQEEFGHRALIHAPIYHAGRLFGILEPCVFKTPRVWTKNDRQVTALVQKKLGPLAEAYVMRIGL
jgi:GAF domain-containing protein